MAKKPMLGGLSTLLIAAFFYSQPLAGNVLAENTPTVESVYPGLAMGFLKSATLAKMDEGTLLQGKGVEIQASFAEKIFGQAPPEMRKELEKSMFFLLEQEAAQEFVKQDAETMGISANQPEKEMFIAYVNGLTKGLTVTEAEARTFYDGNKEMVGDSPFEQVKASIEPFLLQQKKQKTVEAHIEKLGKAGQVRLNEDWVKKQAQLALDNPVDRARMSGKPSMIEFGSTGCVPCEMMQPILENVRKKYPDKLNVVFVHVRENKMLGVRFGIRVIPVQVFYDAKGKEVFRHTGFYAEAEVLKQLKKIGVE